MKTCTFIGHKTAPGEIEPLLQSAVEDLILNERVTNFYIGTHGGFDHMAQKVLKECVKKYPQVKFYIVLAYFPKEDDRYKDYSNTIYSHGLEYVPPKYAIVERNKWMIKNSDFLICYVKNTFSNASRFKEFAIRKGKKVIDL